MVKGDIVEHTHFIIYNYLKRRVIVKIKNLVVGCGFSGVTIARKIAEDLDQKVVIIDAKPHVGGNSYDYFDNNNICIHKYGTHIFHTNSKLVWDFLSKFTKWYPYQHKVKALLDGQYVPIPFNLNSLHQIFPSFIAHKLEKHLIKKFGFNKNVPILELCKKVELSTPFSKDMEYEKLFI